MAVTGRTDPDHRTPAKHAKHAQGLERENGVVAWAQTGKPKKTRVHALRDPPTFDK